MPLPITLEAGLPHFLTSFASSTFTTRTCEADVPWRTRFRSAARALVSHKRRYRRINPAWFEPAANRHQLADDVRRPLSASPTEETRAPAEQSCAS